ncbi:MAG: NAD(P)(+) transhydrogenase (Re/Si-specific) subunit beta [Bacillota bacterium]
MHSSTYLFVSLIIAITVLYGIKLMSSPRTAVRGNLLGALSMFVAVMLVLYYNQILSTGLLWISMAIGASIGYWMAMKVAMIQMPQMVALLNGLGGGASMLVALVVIFESYTQLNLFNRASGQLALIVGGLTLSGSIVAAGKLHRLFNQKPIILRSHSLIISIVLTSMGLLAILATWYPAGTPFVLSVLVTLLSLFFGVLFTLRVGGADMPVTISLLNSFSGLAGAICGFAINDPLLVAIGAIVGAAGLILTQIMCRAMHRSLAEILTGRTVLNQVSPQKREALDPSSLEKEAEESTEEKTARFLKEAEKVIIVPGYGMALAQAQTEVKRLFDLLEAQGKDVKFAIHPVAGRMPGHMNVLLAEVDVPYDKLFEMDAINHEFKETDVAIVVGACDVVNPAAISAEGTPIYGMPILRVDEAKHVIVCNLDTKPGYSGVDNPLYEQPQVTLLLGDAAQTIRQLADDLVQEEQLPGQDLPAEKTHVEFLKEAEKVIIVPGYGMALAQAQTEVKRLFDLLEAQGKDVKFAIHPVAGRMPGHMNVLLAEVDVPYDKLFEMDAINHEFKETDVAIVVGACDVVNPAAISAEGTPIYGMPILRVDEAKHVIVCNLDTKPGYSGVDNPLYEQPQVTLLLGDAAQTIRQLADDLVQEEQLPGQDLPAEKTHVEFLKEAEKVIIVPGYGMALAQAQTEVKRLFDLLEAQGKDVKFAIHPVAGRMPGHMNVLLAEVDVPYDKLFEMDAINHEFKETDVAIVVGACDVVNPAAISAEGTPIYGMPILRVDEAKHVIVCNLDTKPGYSGVDNPLYEQPQVTLLLGDAARTVADLSSSLA